MPVGPPCGSKLFVDEDMAAVALAKDFRKVLWKFIAVCSPRARMSHAAGC